MYIYIYVYLIRVYAYNVEFLSFLNQQSIGLKLAICFLSLVGKLSVSPWLHIKDIDSSKSLLHWRCFKGLLNGHFI